MKKFILPILLVFVSLFLLVVFSSQSNAQVEVDCRKIFDKEMYKCLTDFNSCQDACSEKTKKPDGTLYFNSGEIYTKCMKESDCHGKSSACNEQSLTNLRACGKSDNQPKTAETTRETPKFIEIVNKLPLETITITFFSPKDLEQSKTSADQDVSQDMKVFLEKLEKFKPMTDEEFNKLWSLRPNILPAGEKRIVDIGTGQDQKKGYWWGPDSGAVISSSSWEDIKFKEPIKDNNTQEILRLVELDQGELEVKLKDPDPQNKFGVQGDFFDLLVIQTHFWVSQSQDKKLAVIGVYEGEVEVKTKDGKTVKVKPDGDKPGVVVVSRKLSVAKLVIAGVVLAAVVGGAIIILKRMFVVKGLNKRKN